MRTVVDRFTETYQQLNAQSMGLLKDLYGPDVLFQDPFRRITGLPALTEYFAELYRHVKSVSFRFEETVVQGNSAMLVWTMALAHPRLNHGALITVPGASHIRFQDKVTYHRDYFDGGAMLYEQLPVIGMIVRTIKERM